MGDERSRQFAPGDVIGDEYIIESFLAAGSSCDVYLANSGSPNARVAIKMLRSSADESDFQEYEQQIAFFLREAAVTAQLEHPDIIRLEKIGFDHVVGHFMALEYLPGCHLDSLVEAEGPLGERAVVEIATQVLGALSVAHRADILHRDLKPTNIQCTHYSEDSVGVKLFDFGVAKVTAAQARQPTQVGTLVGTPQWMSPEQAKGEPLEPRSDVYSLGAVLFFLLTGQPPFSNANLLSLFNDVLHTSPQKVNAVRGQLGLSPVSTRLEEAIHKSLQKNRTHRHHDASHFLSSLQSVLPVTEWEHIPTRELTSGGEGNVPGVILFEQSAGDSPASNYREEIEDLVKNAMGDQLRDLTWRNTEQFWLLLEPGLSMEATLSECVQSGLELKKCLFEEVADLQFGVLSTIGYPHADRGKDHAGDPLVEHLYKYYGNHKVEIETTLTSLAEEPCELLVVPPEWRYLLAADFSLLQVGSGFDVPVLAKMPQPEEQNGWAQGHDVLIASLLQWQPMPFPVGKLESTLSWVLPPEEVHDVLSSLQKSGRIYVDEVGVTWHKDEGTGGSLAMSVIAETDRRLMFLFGLHVLSPPGLDGLSLIRIAANLEGVHPLSASSFWQRAAEQLSVSAGIQAADWRASRLAACQRTGAS